jgi:hypothetical protein
MDRLASIATRWESRRRSRRLSWVSIPFEDRDLVFQDFSLVLVPGRLRTAPDGERRVEASARRILCTKFVRGVEAGRLSWKARFDAEGWDGTRRGA